MLRPLLALAFAKLRGRLVVLIQHEWGGLHWARRLVYTPALWLADSIVMFSPLVMRELAADALVGRAARKCTLAPLPPNIEAPAGIVDSELRQRLASWRPAEPRYGTGVMAKYANQVSSASRGAVTSTTREFG